MTKSLADAIKKISTIALSGASSCCAAAELCSVLAEFTDGHVLLVDARGKLLTQTPNIFRFRESVDGLYINSRVLDFLHEINTLNIVEPAAEHVLNLLHSDEASFSYKLILPIFDATECVSTIILCNSVPFDDEDISLCYAVAAIVFLMLQLELTLESSERRRDIGAVKLAVGTLSYSELAAILQIFREIDGEGLTVARHVADKLEIARSVVVNALRKLEGAGIIETRSLGVKGTYIKVLNEVLLEELYKIRK